MAAGDEGRHKRRTPLPKIALGPPEVVPTTETQHRDAVTLLAAMIVDWVGSQRRLALERSSAQTQESVLAGPEACSDIERPDVGELVDRSDNHD